MRNLLLAAASLAALTACSEGPSAPVRPIVPEARAPRDLSCPPTIDCITESGTIDVAAVDVAGGSLTSTAGSQYLATRETRFHPTAIPTEPCRPELTAWNSLVGTAANFRAFLAQIVIPPSPIIPPTPIRYQIVAQVNIGGRFLTDVTPVVSGC